MAYSYAWKDIFRPGKADDFFQEESTHICKLCSPEFRSSDAWLLSELSRLMYMKGENETDAEQQIACRNQYLHKIGLKERWFYNGKRLQCAIVTTLPNRDRSFSVLVFRGTQGRLSTWLFNLKAALSSWPSGGQVHKGFAQLLIEAWSDIDLQLESLAPPLYYTGHSMGGALAVLAASLRKPAAVYTFGSPKIGNSAFVNSIKQQKIHRVVNSRDVVATVPPIRGFEHAGEPQYLSGSQKQFTRRLWIEAPGFLADHSPFNYSLHL